MVAKASYLFCLTITIAYIKIACFSYGRGSTVRYTRDTHYYSTSFCCTGYYDYPSCKGNKL